MGRTHKFQASTSCQAEGTCSESGRDRFSDLPDEFAHHIPSSLDYKDLTRVGAVSKRCRQFHLSVPVVDFGSINSPKGQTDQYLARLLSSLDGYLLDRGHNRIQRFHFGWSFFKTETVKKLCDDQFRVLMWICNALRCNFEELDLLFSQWHQYVFVHVASFILNLCTLYQ